MVGTPPFCVEHLAERLIKSPKIRKEYGTEDKIVLAILDIEAIDEFAIAQAYNYIKHGLGLNTKNGPQRVNPRRRDDQLRSGVIPKGGSRRDRAVGKAANHSYRRR